MIIEEAFVINLDKRKDRLEHITDQCQKNGIKVNRIRAIDGTKVYRQMPKKQRGFRGCYDSHLRVLNTIKDLDADYFLILEDDCVFKKGFKDQLKEIFTQLPEDWDILYLGGSLLNHQAAIDYSENLKRALDVLCAHAYIVRKKAIPSLLGEVKIRQWKVDVLYCKYQKTHNCYIAIPELAWQKAGVSDIEFRSTNNIHLRNLNKK